METPKIKSLAKISEEAHMNGLRKSKSAKEMGELTVVGLGYVSSIVIDHIIKDRASIHTSLVAAVEEHKLPDLGNNSDFHHGYNAGLNNSIKVINSIFKE